jgi:hypothetical protein
MANVIKIKRRKDNVPNYDTTRVNYSNFPGGGPNREYKVGDKCLYQGKIYVALFNNDAIIPTDTTYWQETTDVVKVGGAPSALEGAEIAYNEVNNVLYYGGSNSILSLAGNGHYVSLDTVQAISGDKTFSSSIVLSSAVVSTEITTASSTKVANTEFVQNVFAVIDCGTFDSDGGGGAYFYGTSTSGLGNKWWRMSNWWADSARTIQATTLPTSATNVVVLGSIRPVVDLDRVDWVEPNSINAGSTGISFISQFNRNVSCNIIGNATFNGNTTYNI